MSDLTSTNEENLIALIEKCPDDHYLYMNPSLTGDFLEVYQIPRRLHDDWLRMGEGQRKHYWVSSFMAVAFYPEVWRGKGDGALARPFR